MITQPAQVREIDQEVYKYVGVGGVDQERIVQIGNALVFGEQEILTNTFTSERADVSAVVEGIIGQHMLVQAHVAGHFVAAAEEAGWSPEEIEGRLRRIAGATVIGEIRVVDADGSVAYSNLLPPLAGGSAAAVPYLDEIAPLLDGSEQSLEFATAPRASDGEVYKYVAVAGAGSPRVVQVGIPIESSAGNLLYSVYQREADLLVQSRNLEALWVVNLDRELAAAAPRAGQAGGGDGGGGQRLRASGRSGRGPRHGAGTGGQRGQPEPAVACRARHLGRLADREPRRTPDRRSGPGRQPRRHRQHGAGPRPSTPR